MATITYIPDHPWDALFFFMCPPPCMFACGERERLEFNARYLSWSRSTLSFETESLTESRAYQFRKTSWSENREHLPLFTPQHRDDRHTPHLQTSSSGPGTCIANTSPTEPSPHPRSSFHKRQFFAPSFLSSLFSFNYLLCVVSART